MKKNYLWCLIVDFFYCQGDEDDDDEDDDEDDPDYKPPESVSIYINFFYSYLLRRIFNAKWQKRQI